MGTPDAVVLSRGGRAMGLAEQAGALELCFVDNGLPLDEQVAQCGETPVLIISGKPDTALEVARRLPKLVLIQTFTAGTDWIDVKALAAMGIQVSDNNGANAVAVAEQTIALIYSVYQKLDQQFNSAKAGIWLEGVDLAWDEFHTLENKRVGLIGLGRIGSRVAKRLAGWECEVVFHDTADLDEEYVAATGARRLGYDELLQTSDVVSLHVPLNRLTRGMFTDREFGLMKKKALFINTCRGPVVDEAALIRALQEKRIFGAGLDVTEVEPIQPDNPLLKMPNVLITPHLAACAVESNEKTGPHIVDNIARIARGEAPVSVVAPV